MPHTHPCAVEGCGADVECDDSELERNHDGEPPVICRAFHILNMRPFCEDHAEPDDRPCSECGQRAGPCGCACDDYIIHD